MFLVIKYSVEHSSEIVRGLKGPISLYEHVNFDFETKCFDGFLENPQAKSLHI